MVIFRKRKEYMYRDSVQCRRVFITLSVIEWQGWQEISHCGRVQINAVTSTLVRS